MIINYCEQQSGAIINKERVEEDPRGISEELSLDVGCGSINDTNGDDVITCMRSKDAKVIALTPKHLEFGRVYVDDFNENEEDSTENIFMPEYPWNLLTDGQVNSVPLIIGVVSQEMGHGQFSSKSALLLIAN